MGDRCTVCLTMRRKDVKRFNKHSEAGAGDKLGDFEVDDYPHLQEIVSAQFDDINYAMTDGLLSAAKKKIPFFGDHGDGGEYPSEVFVSVDGDIYYAETNRNGDIIVAVDDQGKPLETVKFIREYTKQLKKVTKLFGIDTTI